MTSSDTKRDAAAAPEAAPTLSVRCGRWFEARATGWGVLMVPLVMACVIAGALLLA